MAIPNFVDHAANPALPATRFVCTLAPRGDLKALIEALLSQGMAIARINGAHGALDELQAFVRSVREALRGRAAVLLDLPGAKIRTDRMGAGLNLEPGAVFELKDDQLTIPEAIALFEPGQRISAADGTIELEVQAAGARSVQLRVLSGGHLGNRKGLNIRGLGALLPFDQSRDLKLLEIAREEALDYVGLSFVRRDEQVRRIRSSLVGSGVRIVAKIETREAVEQLDRILEVADLIMVDRGDLEADLGRPCVPLATREVLRKAKARGVPSIVASQFLISMLERPVPTVAEVSDMSHAVLAGADYLMFSEETAIGQHPIACVRIASDTARAAEQHRDHRPTAILFSAGASPGMGSLTTTRHKCMLDVGGTTVIEHQLDALRRAGIEQDRVRIVTGHGAASLEAYLRGEGFQGEFIYNPWHAQTHILASAWLARPEGPTVFLYGDILFDPAILVDLLRDPRGAVLAVDFDSERSPEDEKVRMDHARVVAASKELSAEDAHGEFIGLARFDLGTTKSLAAVMERMMREGPGTEFLTTAITRLSAAGTNIGAVATGGRPWCDLDFLVDLERARREVWPKLRAQHKGERFA